MGRFASHAVAALALSCTPADIASPDGPLRYAGEAREAKREPLRVIYVDERPGDLLAIVLGVDVQRQVAYLHHSTTTVPHWFDSFDTVDLRGGLRDTWVASDANAKEMSSGSYFHAITGSFEGDLARLAHMVHGARGTTEEGYPTLAVSPDGAHVIYQVFPTDGHDGDWLFAATPDGKNGRRIGALSASYEPHFSPSGAYLAWNACPRCCPCDYGLYLAPVSKSGVGEPARVPGTSFPSNLTWGANDALYAIAGPFAGHRCLYRVDPAVLRAAKVRCSSHAQDGFQLHADPSGTLAVLASQLGPIDKITRELTLVRLDTGAALGKATLGDVPLGVMTLSPRGVFVMGLIDGGLKLLDLRAGREAAIPRADGYWASSAWIDERSLVLVRSVLGKGFDPAGRREIVVADVEALLDAR